MKRERRKPLKHTKVRPFTVYPPIDIDQRLRDLAFTNGRTLTEQTVRVIRKGLEALDAKPEQVA